jgi:signal transduction histidine kinase
MMRKLYLQIYISFVAILVLFGILTAIGLLVIAPGLENVPLFDGIGSLAGEWLPGPNSPAEDLQAALERLQSHVPASFNLRGADGALLAAVGETLPAPSPERTQSGWMRAGSGGATAAFRLPDGRWLVSRYVHRRQGHPGSGLLILVLLALAVAVGAYPVVRRLTRRLERLKTGVDELGAGDLRARVEVEGNDEVASLAKSFNRAADQIEHLVQAQRSVLAGASHELRTPLARLGVATELLGGDERPELRARVSKDIAELDELIGELLVASRLDATDKLEHSQDVDLLALLAEEAARSEATITGEPVLLRGDPRLLRRLIRNLLENAGRYAGGSPIEASVEPHGAGAVLRVADRGPGVPAEERDRIFEPFYRPAGFRKSSDKGVGLGLSLVRQIARHHQGEARCLPREGGGTCFEVIFPRP